MKNNLLGVLVASMFALPALSTYANGSGSGSGGSGGGSGGSSPASTSSSSSATGGAGGAGGAANGGSATGGTAAGGSSSVTVSVSVPTSSNSGNGTTAGPAAAEVGAVAEPGSSAYNTKATVDYGGNYTVKTVPSVISPSLTATLSDTCMGSASFGLSVVGFGATGGTTVVDDACVRRLDSREFRAMGMNDVALALLCQSDANRKAIESTGRSCPSVIAPTVSLAQPKPVMQTAPVASLAPPSEAITSAVMMPQPEVSTTALQPAVEEPVAPTAK